MTTEAKGTGALLAQVISDVQSDTKRAFTALTLSLHTAGHLNHLQLKEIAEKMLSDIPERTPQNSGILELLLTTAQTIEAEKREKNQSAASKLPVAN